MKFNGHRLEQHPNFKLILISRLSSPNIPVEFASLCTCVNFAPNQDSVKNELNWRTYSFLRPELISCKHELCYNACLCMKRLHHIDEAMLKEIKGETELQQLWTSNSSLDELSKERKTVNFSSVNIAVECGDIMRLLCKHVNIILVMIKS